MATHSKELQRIERLSRLNEKSGDKYCWAHLVTNIGMYRPYDPIEAKEECRTGEQCKADSIREGTCWCRKFVNGALNQ